MAEYVKMIVVSVCLIIVFLWFQFRNRNAILTSWPVLGMSLSMFRNAPRIHDFVADIVIRSGGTFMFRGPWFSNMDFLFTCDPRNINYVLTENFGNFIKGPKFRDIFLDWGDGILNVDKDLWKMQRKMILSSLRTISRFLRSGIKAKVADGLIPRLNLASEEREEIDLQELFHQFTFDTACLMVLGIDPDSLSGKSVKYQKAFDKMEGTAISRIVSPSPYWKVKRWLRIGIEKQCREAVKTMDSLLYECISLQTEQLKRARAQGEEANSTILTAFLDQLEEDVTDRNGDVKVSTKLLRDVALNMLFAGRDTISDSLTWFFFFVARHPLVENKLVREIEENSDTTDIVEEESGLFPEAKLGSLVFLHAALCETLRLYPPVSFNMKYAEVPDRLPTGHELGRNAKIVIPFYATGRMESVWGSDCREFKPERWISEQGHIIVQVPSNKFPVFNAGPRTCLGKDLSFIQMKMVAASVMLNFHIEVVGGHPVKTGCSISVQMKHGLKVRVRRRKSSR